MLLSAGGKNETRFFPLEAKKQNTRAELKADMHQPTVIKQQQMVVVVMIGEVLVLVMMIMMMVNMMTHKPHVIKPMVQVMMVIMLMMMMVVVVVVVVVVMMMTCIDHMLSSNSRWTWSRPSHKIRALRQDKLRIRDDNMVAVFHLLRPLVSHNIRQFWSNP